MAEDTKVVDLQQFRKLKDQKQAEAEGEDAMFAFHPYIFDDQGLGFIDAEPDMPVIVIISPLQRVGIRMSRTDAKKLGMCLIEMSETK